MATNQTLKAQVLAFRLVLAAEKIMDGQAEFQALLREYTNAGMTFQDAMFTAAFRDPTSGSNVDLTHVDAATMLAAGTAFNNMLTWMNANGVTAAFDKITR